MPNEEIPGPAKPYKTKKVEEVSGDIPDPYGTLHDFFNPKQSNPDSKEPSHHTDTDNEIDIKKIN